VVVDSRFGRGYKQSDWAWLLTVGLDVVYTVGLDVDINGARTPCLVTGILAVKQRNQKLW
jgi:hypothetical protein